MIQKDQKKKDEASFCQQQSNRCLSALQTYIRMPIDNVEIAVVGFVGVGASYLAYLLLGLQAILVIVLIAAAVLYLLARRWFKLRQKGLITLLGQKARSVLLERSILDIFRDLVYFPYVTKIIATYLRIAATKPHPQQLQEVLKQLPKEVADASNKKGLLSLAPSFVEQLVLPIQSRQLLPNNYGKVDSRWDNVERYNLSEDQVHEQTMEKRFVHFLDGKLGWPTAFVLLMVTAVGVVHMRPHRFKKMILQNTTFACMLLALIALLVKARKVMRHRERVQALKEKEE